MACTNAKLTQNASLAYNEGLVYCCLGIKSCWKSYWIMFCTLRSSNNKVLSYCHYSLSFSLILFTSRLIFLWKFVLSRKMTLWLAHLEIIRWRISTLLQSSMSFGGIDVRRKNVKLCWFPFFRPYGKIVPHEDWWKIYESLAKKFRGKPHWAKFHKVSLRHERYLSSKRNYHLNSNHLYFIQETSEYFCTVYKNYNEFMAIREKLDPENIFVNRYWERILQD